MNYPQARGAPGYSVEQYYSPSHLVDVGVSSP